MNDAIRIAYEIAYGQLRSQKSDLQFFRGQAAFAAAISGLVATFFAGMLGGKLVGGEQAVFFGLSFPGLLGFSFFGFSIGCAVKAFMDWRTCKFDLNPLTALHYAEHELPYEDLLKVLASDADKYFDENEKIITDVRHYLGMALLSGWCQIPAWLAVVLE